MKKVKKLSIKEGFDTIKGIVDLDKIKSFAGDTKNAFNTSRNSEVVPY
jgi:hypothetical protein